MTNRLFQACLLLLVAVPLLLAGCSDKVGPPSPSSTGTISGTVLDSVTHAPIAGAWVSLWSATDTVLRDSIRSDVNGHFTLGAITPRSYFFVVDSGDYNTYVEQLAITAGSNITRTIYLSRYSQTSSQPSVLLHVEDAVTGLPILTATVDGLQVDSAGNSRWYSNSTGDMVYTVWAPRYDSVVASVYLIAGEEIFDTVHLVPHFDTLLAEYKFSGSAVDSSGKGHDGTLHGGTFVYDRFGNANSALQLNGTSDYISIPNAPDLNFGNSESFTLCFWVKCQAQNPPSNDHYLIHKIDSSTGMPIGYDASNYQYAFNGFAGTTAASTQNPGSALGTDNNWNFIAFVFDASGTTSFYFNGVTYPYYTWTDVSIARALRGPMPNTVPLLIGGDGSAAHAFKGSIDDVRIYRGALLPSDIDSLYHENGW